MNMQSKKAAAVEKRTKMVMYQLASAKRKLYEAEQKEVCKHELKTFGLEKLGDGAKDAGGAKGRAARHEALDRLSKLGSGLSAGQKNDFPWWKEAWDKKMLQEHKANWPKQFAEWANAIVHDNRRNAFSKFMHDETVRVLLGGHALVVPGIGKTVAE